MLFPCLFEQVDRINAPQPVISTHYSIPRSSDKACSCHPTTSATNNLSLEVSRHLTGQLQADPSLSSTLDWDLAKPEGPESWRREFRDFCLSILPRKWIGSSLGFAGNVFFLRFGFPNTSQNAKRIARVSPGLMGPKKCEKSCFGTPCSRWQRICSVIITHVHVDLYISWMYRWLFAHDRPGLPTNELSHCWKPVSVWFCLPFG